MKIKHIEPAKPGDQMDEVTYECPKCGTETKRQFKRPKSPPQSTWAWPTFKHGRSFASHVRLLPLFSPQLSSQRIPETATVCQEWASRCMEMAAEDTKRLLADGQKFVETGARLLSNGWLSNGRGGST
jgi:hypothetical protein